MPLRRDRFRRYLLPMGVAAVIFGLDAISDVDIVSILYVNVILLAMRSRRREDIVVAGCGSIGLTIASFLMTLNPRHPIATVLINNGLSVSTIACVMVLCLRNFDSQTEIVQARDRIALVSRSTVLQTMSAAIIHEITQPLTAIGASAQAAYRWLHQSPPNREESEMASRRIVAEAERAADVVRRLERLTQPEQISAETFELRPLIDLVVKRLCLEIEDAVVDVDVECPADLKISADRVMIEQVVINAVGNAIDSLRTVPVGKRSIGIEAKASLQSVAVAIRDNGAGADPATLEYMFDPFFTTKPGSGMGIGLAVSKSMIDAHGGTIRAAVNPCGGVVVAFELPRLRTRSEAEQPR